MLTTPGVHPFVREIRFYVPKEDRFRNGFGCYDISFNFTQGCISLLDLCSQFQFTSLSTLAPTTISLSCVQITDEILRRLSCLSSLRYVTLDNVIVEKTPWRHAFDDLPPSKVTELRLLNIGPEVERRLRRTVEPFSHSLTTIRIEPPGWLRERVIKRPLVACKEILAACGLQEDGVRACPKLAKVRFFAMGAAGAVRRKLVLKARPPTTSIPTEETPDNKSWGRKYSIGSGNHGWLVPEEKEELPWGEVLD